MFFMRLWYSFLDRMNDRKFKAVFVTVCLCFVIIAGAVIGAAVVFDNKADKEAVLPDFFADSDDALLVNGVDVSGMSETEAAQLFNELAEGYSLSVLIDGDEAGVIYGRDIALKYNNECGLGRYLTRQDKSTSGVSEYIITSPAEETITRESKESIRTSENNIIINNIWIYDEEKLASSVNSIIKSSGAAELKAELVNIEYSTETGYSLSLSDNVKFVDTDEVMAEIRLAIENNAECVKLDSNGIYFADSNSLLNGDERLKTAVETLNLYAGSVMNYDFNGELMVIDKRKTNRWFYLDEEFNVNIDEDAVQIYTNKLAEDFTDYSGTLPFVTSYGTTVNFKTASLKQVDITALFNYLMEDVKKGTVVNRTVPYADTGAAVADGTFGGTYAEINLTKQHLFFYYKGNLIVDCDIVSGSVDKGYATPGGIFTVRYKKKNATLKGADYSTPVDYWMPFNGGIGMHDADWRIEFGGSIYLEDGSHGCINMPAEAVSTVFEYAYPGMYVVVYGGAYSLDDAAAKEALKSSSTEAVTEEIITKAATKAETVTEAGILKDSTTEYISKPVLTEAETKSEILTEIFTEAPQEASTEVRSETSAETSGEAAPEGSDI